MFKHPSLHYVQGRVTRPEFQHLTPSTWKLCLIPKIDRDYFYTGTIPNVKKWPCILETAFNCFNVTKMHSSRMRTACSIPYRGCLSRGGSLSRGSLSRVSVQGLCLGGLFPGRSLSRGSLSRGISVKEIPLPRLPLDRQTHVKMLPYPKLRLWAVKTSAE